MIRRTALITALPLTAAILLAGCGGTTPTTTPSTAASASAAAPSQAASASASTSASSAPSATTAAAITDPCEIISSAAMAKLVHADLGKATSSSDDESKSCAYAVASGGSTKVFDIIGLAKGSLKSQLSSIESEAKITAIDLDGFDEAYSLSATQSGTTIAGVAAQKGGLGYIVAIGGAKSFDTYEPYCEDVVTTLAAG